MLAMMNTTARGRPCIPAGMVGTTFALGCTLIAIMNLLPGRGAAEAASGASSTGLCETAGRMPAFKALRHNDIVQIGADRWQAHNGSKPYSVSAANGEFRFEVRSGDRAPFDGEPKERSELMSITRFPSGKLFTARFEFLVEPGPVTSRQWIIPFQIHQDDPSGAPAGSNLKASIGASPLFSLYIVAKDGKEVLQVRGDTSPASPLKQFARGRVFAEVPFERGVRHAVALELVDNNGADEEPFEPGTEWQGHYGANGNFGRGTGRLKVTFNGRVLVDKRDIPMGYAYASPASGGKGSYAKFGIYAQASKDPADTGIVMRYWNPSFTIAK